MIFITNLVSCKMNWANAPFSEFVNVNICSWVYKAPQIYGYINIISKMINCLSAKSLVLSLLSFFGSSFSFGQEPPIAVEILIIGGGASGISAGIQAGREGVQTTIVESGPWLGGMLTAAGVSAIDGNHQLPSGIWGEFRDSIYSYYGGPSKVATGWVSNTLFEPSIGDIIFKKIAKSLPSLRVDYNLSFFSIERENEHWLVNFKDKKAIEVKYRANFIIDATELGQVMAALKIPYDMGMEAASLSGEKYGPEDSNSIIQDLTFTAILERTGKSKKMKRPRNYDPTIFECACDNSSELKPTKDCIQMLDYARLPNDKYLINWPNCGNDFYTNLMGMDDEKKAIAINDAKNKTLQFLYYIQNDLGFKNLGLAVDEFPTKDNLPLIPYHRESRRLKGLVRLKVQNLENPYSQDIKYYRTGIAVGDYPIDHHHKENNDAPKIDFIGIKVPSYSVPVGVLIPEQQTPNFLVAEKSVSVSNIVNGTTRLQPVVLGIGQAAGAIAVYCIRNGKQPWNIDIREVQQQLLDANAYIMPYIDVNPSDTDFEVMQKIGATGLIKGVGVPYEWANQTWFYPEGTISEYEMVEGFKDFYGPSQISIEGSGKLLTTRFLLEIIAQIHPAYEVKVSHYRSTVQQRGVERNLTRREAALLIDTLMDPFSIPVNFKGIPKVDKHNNK